MYEKIPDSARMPCDSSSTLWVNNRGDTITDPQLIGEKVLAQQQVASPPDTPKILVISDQVLEHHQAGDKYMKVLAMMGYTISNYVLDIRDGFIDLQFPYIVVHLGTMQLKNFIPEQVWLDVEQLLQAIDKINPFSHVLFSGLLPQPLDYPRSKSRCDNYSCAYKMAVEEFRVKKGWNCGFIHVQPEFLDGHKNIKDPQRNFVDELYLSVNGIRLLRAAWLRHLGFFPKKAVELNVE